MQKGNLSLAKIYLYRIDGYWVAKDWQSVKLTKPLTGYMLEQWMYKQRNDNYCFDATGEVHDLESAIKIIRNDLQLFKPVEQPMIKVFPTSRKEHGRSVD
jgi:hypothetical protein